MNRRNALLALAAVACSKSAEPSSFARSALAIAREVGEASSEEEAWARGELMALSATARSAIDRSPTRDPADVLVQLLFDEASFVREVDDPSLEFVLLPRVLRSRRGSCVGLGSVFLALAESLALPAHGVLMPGHFFVRMAGSPSARNVELLRRGEQLSDAWYGARWPIPGGAAAEYARPLSVEESSAVIAYDVGNERKRAQRLNDARRAYQRATELFPGFAEAHASLGATLHLLGDFAAAAGSYRAAQRANPRLPGVEQNLALLEQEASGQRLGAAQGQRGQ